jgi:DAACS family dicarboxylate/amino acid:cation (Na+ or H+) symporter
LIQQMTVLILCVFAGIGTAGVPGGSLPATVLVLQTIGVNAGGIAIILGVDRLLDMARTTLNVVGDLVVAQCVDRMEGGMGQETALPAGQPSAGGPDSQGGNRQL